MGICLRNLWHTVDDFKYTAKVTVLHLSNFLIYGRLGSYLITPHPGLPPQGGKEKGRWFLTCREPQGRTTRGGEGIYL